MSASVRVFKSRVSAFCPVGLSPVLQRRNPVRCPVGEQRRSVTHTAGEQLRPLDGVRVLDLTRVLAGPFATMILGDLGAEVIKVERPGAGDDTRAWGPPFVGTESAYFLSVNRNKKSIAVNMKHPEGAKIILELAGVCDVLIENYLPGKLQQMGLGYEQLSRVNQQLIYCSISGYGQTGPQSQSPGYDSIASAVSGMMHITGPEVLQLMELTEEPRYKTNKLRVQNRKQLLHILSQRFLQEKTADWLQRFQGSGVPVGPINNIQEVFSDAQVKHNSLIQEMKHPTAGRIAVPGPAVRFSSFTSDQPTPPPLIGQHTSQVLRDTLSYSDDIITALLESGAVAQNEVS
ncbi:succinate--hydroxymethylglutarate CoA-transferase isoform X2 [Scomber scombrus]|uniref:Succinate--hydroxymethylglutarate CoA-transferase isoform X2 n=1 Tax=Scomber scombrus TaxID=13677 RepID=A0AAV1QA72_SCOSC